MSDNNENSNENTNLLNKTNDNKIENSNNNIEINNETNYIENCKLKLLNYYMTYGNMILNYYNCFYDKLFLIRKIKNAETSTNLIYKYYFLYWFYSFLNLYCYLMPEIFVPTSIFRFFIYHLDKPNKILYLNASKNNITRNIFLKNYSMSKIITDINYDTLFDQNQLIMMKKIIIIDISLESNDSNYSNISLKEIISKYSDKDKNFEENKLKNVLINENINYEKYNKIKITSLKLIRKEIKELDLNENLDKHVTFFFE